MTPEKVKLFGGKRKPARFAVRADIHRRENLKWSCDLDRIRTKHRGPPMGDPRVSSRNPEYGYFFLILSANSCAAFSMSYPTLGM